MSYEVLARKYRPRLFEEVAGQEAITRVLRGAIEQDRVGHAFLFCGPRGVGKTSTARILAAALDCERGPTTSPCGECGACCAIAQGHYPDVVEIDGASNRKIDDIRTLREQVNYAPMHGRIKLYIIDEVHQLTPEAFNALLKTLEEPPAHVKFIFATTEVEKVPETIRSRCQIHEFRRIREEDITARLEQICAAEGRPVGREVLDAIARGVRGGMRDAQTLLDQLLALGAGEPTLEDLERIRGRCGMGFALHWLEAAGAGAADTLLLELDEVLNRGRREEDLIEDLVEALRELLLLDTLGGDNELSTIPPEQRPAWLALAAAVGSSKGDASAWIDGALALLLHARADIRRGLGSARLVLELALVRLSRLAGVASLEEIVQRLEDGGFEPPAAQAPATASPERIPVPAPPPRAPAREEERERTASAPAGASAAPASIEEVFGRFLEELAHRDRGLGELCQRRMEPAGWSDDHLQVRLVRADFSELAILGDLTNKRLLLASLKEVLGPGAELEIEGGGAAQPTAAPPPDDLSSPAGGGAQRTARAEPQRPARPDPPADPLFEHTKSLFDGEEVE